MTKLEKATHLSLIVVCCVAAFALVKTMLVAPQVDLLKPRDLVGRAVKLPGADWNAARLTVLLQLSSTCHFCNESMPFYQTLGAVREHQAGRFQLIVATSDSVGVMERHLAERQVNVDKVLHSRLESIGNGFTPAVFVVDSGGLVKQAFIGKLDPPGEKKLLSILEAGKM